MLHAFVTGEECDHGRHLRQLEIEKALALSVEDPINILRIRTPVASNY